MSNTWLKTSHFLREIEHCIKEDLANTEAGNLSIVSIYILAALYERDGQRPMDLATATGTAATGFTPILDKLVNANLVMRAVNKKDRRSILIYLTSKGKQLQTVIENALGNAEVRYGGG